MRKGGRAYLWADLVNSSNTVVVGPSQVDITLPDCLVIGSSTVAPQVVQPPANAQGDAGGSVYFSVVASGTRPLSYQWQRNGVNIAGATYEWLVLSNLSVADAGSYTVRVGNAAGTVSQHRSHAHRGCRAGTGHRRAARGHQRGARQHGQLQRHGHRQRGPLELPMAAQRGRHQRRHRGQLHHAGHHRGRQRCALRRAREQCRGQRQQRTGSALP
ncbi:immunoglobulin domain-containing protein [Paucibacter sp. O1-1]|nr:immunoglobulin domain-containing protein [Paucibacter sp. O1-1]MDA3829935.1 immunoglobulin domain-containing protein [Paucibacter sp. O1-1]